MLRSLEENNITLPESTKKYKLHAQLSKHIIIFSIYLNGMIQKTLERDN